jgi:hypothetical protein
VLFADIERRPFRRNWMPLNRTRKLDSTPSQLGCPQMLVMFFGQVAEVNDILIRSQRMT